MVRRFVVTHDHRMRLVAAGSTRAALVAIGLIGLIVLSACGSDDDDEVSRDAAVTLDGRTFVFLPYDEWSRTRIYEIDDEGVATERGDTLGDVFKWVRVR